MDGFIIPVASPAGRIRQVYFGGAAIDLPERELPALHLMAIFAVDRALRLRGLPNVPQFALSLRECEVLTQAALGRSTDEIADALNIRRAL